MTITGADLNVQGAFELLVEALDTNAGTGELFLPLALLSCPSNNNRPMQGQVKYSGSRLSLHYAVWSYRSASALFCAFGFVHAGIGTLYQGSEIGAVLRWAAMDDAEAGGEMKGATSRGIMGYNGFL